MVQGKGIASGLWNHPSSQRVIAEEVRPFAILANRSAPAKTLGPRLVTFSYTGRWPRPDLSQGHAGDFHAHARVWCRHALLAALLPLSCGGRHGCVSGLQTAAGQEAVDGVLADAQQVQPAVVVRQLAHRVVAGDEAVDGGLRGFDEAAQVCRLVDPASPAVEGLHWEVRARVAAVSPKVSIARPDRGRDAAVSCVFLMPIPET